MRGVILYGPPAAGKDAITRQLEEIDQRFKLFPRLKVGAGRTAGYRIATRGEVASLQARGDIVWENHRYGASYYIDRNYLREQLRHSIPVVHMGQLAAVDAVKRSFPGTSWLTVYLWCPREVAVERIRARETHDDDERLSMWDATEPLPNADFQIDTAMTSIEAAARLIASLSEDRNGK